MDPRWNRSSFRFLDQPNEASFRPFLTDFVFRERLRLLNDEDAADSQSQSTDAAADASKDAASIRKSDPSSFSSLLSSASYSSSPFALTFGSRLRYRCALLRSSDRTMVSSPKSPFTRACPFVAHMTNKEYLSTPGQMLATRLLHTDQPTAHRSSSEYLASGGYWVSAFPSFRIHLLLALMISLKLVEKSLRPTAQTVLIGVSSRCALLTLSPNHDPIPLLPMTTPRNRHQLNLILVILQPRKPSFGRLPSTSATKDTATDVESEDCLSINALVARAQVEIADLQEQLAQVKSTSTKASEALEQDLEEIRAKKKEEERLRSEIKTRTKALDDSKRQVESTRREAERDDDQGCQCLAP